ncbi:MAG: saccharopine dehydrogenase, partial [Cyanobacteria bacterium P01_D01_bin.6]
MGRQVATLIRQRHPDLQLIIAGRNLEKAAALANELGNARGLQLNVEQPNLLTGKQPRAIVAAVNDLQDYLLMNAVQQGIPYVDITRWPERLRASVAELAGKSLSAPVLFSSG